MDRPVYRAGGLGTGHRAGGECLAHDHRITVDHPTPFPVELPRRLIQLYTQPGDVVLDPFMGSGSTAVAAVSQAGTMWVTSYLRILRVGAEAHRGSMSVIVTGSIAYDYLMCYPGHFREHILLDEVGKISVSFLVDEKQMHRGGVGPNIAYSLALLGHRPRLMGTAGRDFAEYAAWLQAQGVDTSLVRVYPDEFTATFTAITDLDQNQIAGFHAGAMSRARELSFKGMDREDIDLVIISPNDPAGHGQVCAGVPGAWHPLHLRSQPAVGTAGWPGAAGQHARRPGADRQRLRAGDDKNKTGLDETGILDHVGMLVVTRGADGASLMSKDRRVDVPAVAPDAVRDPTGVGDAFRAGLITGLVRGYRWEVTGRLGALAATYVLEQVGTMNHHYTAARVRGPLPIQLRRCAGAGRFAATGETTE